MIPLPLLDGDTLVIDNSSLELQTTCPRAAQYGLCLRKRSSSDRVALRFGGIAHKVLEARYRSGAPMLEQTPDVEKTMIAVAETEFQTFHPPEDEYRNLDRMIELIHEYGKNYQFEPFDILRLPDGRPSSKLRSPCLSVASLSARRYGCKTLSVSPTGRWPFLSAGPTIHRKP